MDVTTCNMPFGPAEYCYYFDLRVVTCCDMGRATCLLGHGAYCVPDGSHPGCSECLVRFSLDPIIGCYKVCGLQDELCSGAKLVFVSCPVVSYTIFLCFVCSDSGSEPVAARCKDSVLLSPTASCGDQIVDQITRY